MGVAVLFACYDHTDPVGKLSLKSCQQENAEKITYLHFETVSGYLGSGTRKIIPWVFTCSQVYLINIGFKGTMGRVLHVVI